MTLIVVSIVMSALGGVVGVRSLMMRRSADNTPRAIGYVHAVVTTLSLILLVIYAVLHSTGVPILAFGLFAVAAIAGFILLGIDLAKKKLRSWLVFLHGGLALAGLVFLAVFALGGNL